MQLLRAIVLVISCGFLFCQTGQAQNPVQQKVRGLASQQVHSLCDRCEVSVETKWMPDEISRLDTARISQVEFNEVGLPRGYQTVNIRYMEKGQMQSRQLQLLIEVRQDLPVVNKRMERNQKITSADLTWKKKNITRMKKLPIGSPEEILGQATSRAIPKGGVIQPSDLQQLPIIEAGDDVQMIYRVGGVEVAMTCRARQAKAKGEMIRIYSDETRKTYVAKVVTPTKVIWEKTL